MPVIIMRGTSGERCAKLFPARLKKLRLKKGWTQADLALKAGMSRLCITRYELSYTLPSMANLIDIADALDVELDYLCSPHEV